MPERPGVDRGTWARLAAQIAVDSIRATTAAGSGHPTSSLSCAHLLAVLASSHFRCDLEHPDTPTNDRLILSKGHAAPALYATLKALGAIDDRELLSLRHLGSRVEGHPAPVAGMPLVEVATGSLGQGLSAGLGMALAMRLDHSPARVWVLLGDSEMAEGSVWEALGTAAYHGVRNLVAIVDVNRLGQRGPTMLGWDCDTYVARAKAFGWRALAIDGHDVDEIDRAYREAADGSASMLLAARTEKGHGVSFLADAEGWHGRPLSPKEAERAIAELGGEAPIRVTPLGPAGTPGAGPSNDRRRPRRGRTASGGRRLPTYDGPVATRKAFGEALAALAPDWPDLVVLDGEVANSTYTEDFEKAAPERFFQMFIAEANMVGVAVGLQALGKVAVAATFGAFLTRAYDFIRMAAVSRAGLRLCGSHAGASIGEDGPSQMALEDLAMMRAVHGSTVLYPADGHATVRLVETMLALPGISYLRTTREKTPLLYGPDEEFPVGGSKVLRRSGQDRATVVGAGVTLHEALAAADELAARGILIRVVDAYSVKPVDGAGMAEALSATGRLVVVEDHWPEGGLGEAVLSALAALGVPGAGRVTLRAVSGMPGSGKPEELRSALGISARHIVSAVETSLSPQG